MARCDFALPICVAISRCVVPGSSRIRAPCALPALPSIGSPYRCRRWAQMATATGRRDAGAVPVPVKNASSAVPRLRSTESGSPRRQIRRRRPISGDSSAVSLKRALGSTKASERSRLLRRMAAPSARSTRQIVPRAKWRTLVQEPSARMSACSASSR
ncbi:hypothetical protein D9M72_547930 [compost metagenome]